MGLVEVTISGHDLCLLEHTAGARAGDGAGWGALAMQEGVWKGMLLYVLFILSSMCYWSGERSCQWELWLAVVFQKITVDFSKSVFVLLFPNRSIKTCSICSCCNVLVVCNLASFLLPL